MPAVVRVSPSEVKRPRCWDKLSTPAEFDAVFSARCASHGEYARVLARASAHPLPRLGITVSKKVCKTAVGRNYMKRVSRELFRVHAPALHGIDVVVLMRKRFRQEEFAEHTKFRVIIKGGGAQWKK